MEGRHVAILVGSTSKSGRRTPPNRRRVMGASGSVRPRRMLGRMESRANLVQHFGPERYLSSCSVFEPTPRKVPLLDSLASLAAAAAGGSTPATSDLLERVWPDAYRIAWSVLGERTAAEDAAQEACARLWASIGTLRRPDAFVGWFYRIVVNEAKRRRRTLRRTASLDATAATDAGAPRRIGSTSSARYKRWTRRCAWRRSCAITTTSTATRSRE